MAQFAQTITDSNNSVSWFTLSDRTTPHGSVDVNQLWTGVHPLGTYFGDSALRFTGVSIPPGATIVSANLYLNVNYLVGAPVTILKGNDVDDAVSPTTSQEGVDLVRTSASVNPNIESTGGVNIDVKTIVEEILSRAGWASGNALQFIHIDNGSATNNYVRIDAVATYSRTLTIDYTTGWSGKIMTISSPAKVMDMASISKIMGI